jgi:hypothetical protein
MSSRDLAARIVQAGQTGGGLSLRYGTVTAISGGMVTVTLAGGSDTYRHLASYAPTVGDVVAMLQDGPDLLVLGDLA